MIKPIIPLYLCKPFETLPEPELTGGWSHTPPLHHRLPSHPCLNLNIWEEVKIDHNSVAPKVRPKKHFVWLLLFLFTVVPHPFYVKFHMFCLSWYIFFSPILIIDFFSNLKKIRNYSKSLMQYLPKYILSKCINQTVINDFEPNSLWKRTAASVLPKELGDSNRDYLSPVRTSHLKSMFGVTSWFMFRSQHPTRGFLYLGI